MMLVLYMLQSLLLMLLLKATIAGTQANFRIQYPPVRPRRPGVSVGNYPRSVVRNCVKPMQPPTDPVPDILYQHFNTAI